MTIKFFLKIMLISIETKNHEILNDWRLKLVIKNIFFLQLLLLIINVKFIILLPLFTTINAVILLIYLPENDISSVWNEVIAHLKSQKKHSKYLAIITSLALFIKITWEKFIL